MKSSKKRHIMLRVFFVVACLSLVGMIIGQHTKFTTKVKIHGGSFTEGVIGSPRFINPVLAQSSTDKDITKLVFGSLISITDDTIHYDLAQNLEISEDKKEYTLDLRKDLFFHDDEHITADDVVFTIEKIQDSLIKSPFQILWEGVTVEKKDTYTVTFKLAKVYADFAHNLQIGILPKHIWKDVSPEEFIFSPYNTDPIGSGPYKVSEIKESIKGTYEKYTLERRDDFRNTYIDEIIFRIFENEESRVKAYNEGFIDTIYGASQHENKLAVQKNTETYTGTLPSIFGIFFNQNNNIVLKDNYIRKVISQSINIRQIIEQVYQDDARHIDNFTGNPSREDNYKPAQAQSTLEKNDWLKNKDGIYTKDGKLLMFTLSTSNNEQLKKFAEYTQVNLQKNGILMEIKIFDEGDFTQNVIRPRDYEAVLFGYKIQKKTDLYAFWHSSQKNNPGLNLSLYNNKNVDKALQSVRLDLEDFDEQSIADEINKDVPALFLYSPTYRYLLPKDVQGVSVSIVHREDRFDTIANWYIKTRHVWNIFTK